MVELLAADACEVDFADETGQTYAQPALRADQFLVLRYQAAAQ